MVWQYCSAIPVGRRGVLSSFKWFLPAVAMRRGWGGGGGTRIPDMYSKLRPLFKKQINQAFLLDLRHEGNTKEENNGYVDLKWNIHVSARKWSWRGARIFKRLRIPGIDSANLWILAGRYYNPIQYLSCRSARLHRLAETIPLNRFLGYFLESIPCLLRQFGLRRSCVRPHPSLQQASGQIFPDDVNVFSLLHDIKFWK
jgi:hypothetical protein